MRKIITTVPVALLGLMGGHAALAQQPPDMMLVTTKMCSAQTLSASGSQ